MATRAARCALAAAAIVCAADTASGASVVEILKSSGGVWVGSTAFEGVLHAEWLRERCQSQQSVDLHTLQPLVSPHSYPTPLIDAADIVQTGDAYNHTEWLRVAFADGHMSSFEMVTLGRKVEAEKNGHEADALMQVANAEAPKRTPWRVDMTAPPVVEYPNLVNGKPEGQWTRLTVLRHLQSSGIVLVRGVPQREGECVKMANTLSTLRTTEWGETFDVQFTPTAPSKEAEKVKAAEAEIAGFEGAKVKAIETEEFMEAAGIKQKIMALRTELFALRQAANSSAGAADAEGDKDLAYTGLNIAMHTDNPYRYPTPDIQLLHAIRQCSCARVNKTAPCDECTVTNGFADGLRVAERMAQETPELFDALVATPVRFENDGGGGRSALWHTSPILEAKPEYVLAHGACHAAHCIKSIRYSAKSGGYAPLLDDFAKLDRFYAARRRFSKLIHDPAMGIQMQLSTGDMIIFDNTRVLHSRSAIAESDGGRHLQGCYMDGDGVAFNAERLRRQVMLNADDEVVAAAGADASSETGGDDAPLGLVEFRSMANGTKADYELMTKHYCGACTGKKLAERALDLLKAQDTVDTMLGARVSLYEHGLQTASRAFRDGADEETVVVALLHDIGELISPASHGDVIAGMLVPFISPKNHWVLSHHEIFQGYHYFQHVGGNRHQRDEYKEHEFYQACADFCDKWDQASFDEAYQSLPLSFFEPMVERLYSRKAYWWDPSHPKAVAVTGDGALE